MDKTKIKYLVGIYAAAMCIMGMLVPVPIVASVAAAFPNEHRCRSDDYRHHPVDDGVVRHARLFTACLSRVQEEDDARRSHYRDAGRRLGAGVPRLARPES